MKLRQIGPGMLQQMQSQCSDCGGSGEFIREKDRCKKCKGKRVNEVDHKLEVCVCVCVFVCARVFVCEFVWVSAHTLCTKAWPWCRCCVLPFQSHLYWLPPHSKVDTLWR